MNLRKVLLRTISLLPGVFVWAILGWPIGAVLGPVEFILALLAWEFIKVWKNRVELRERRLQ